jgi:hypothetical protein
VYPFFDSFPFATLKCLEKEDVDKMISHFVTAPFCNQLFVFSMGYNCFLRFYK